jgi:hypothetical protein
MRKVVDTNYLRREELRAYPISQMVVGRRAAAGNLRNDAIDANLAAFATYFGGLLTRDAKPAEIHANARFLLKQCFVSLRK